MDIVCDRPWLVAELEGPHRVLSWSLTAPGFVTARRIVWREVRNADLPAGFDALSWLKRDMVDAGHGEAGFATGPDGAAATGTGTDCVVIASPIASPIGGDEAVFAGLHTALGEAVGAAVLAAMRAAVGEWMAECGEGAIHETVE